MDLFVVFLLVYFRKVWSVCFDCGYGGYWKDWVVIEEEFNVGINGVNLLEYFVGNVWVCCVMFKEIFV